MRCAAVAAGAGRKPSGLLFCARLWCLAALSCALPALAADPGWFGLTLKIDAGGSWLNPVIESASVQSVAPGSPAAAQHLAAGDTLVEVEGVPVAQADGEELKRRMHKAVGETLHLRLKHPDGTLYSADLVGAPRPQ